jgi:hypothetical protein
MQFQGFVHVFAQDSSDPSVFSTIFRGMNDRIGIAGVFLSVSGLQRVWCKILNGSQAWNRVRCREVTEDEEV